MFDLHTDYVPDLYKLSHLGYAEYIMESLTGEHFDIILAIDTIDNSQVAQ